MLAGLALCGVKSIKLEISEDTDMARWLIKLRYSPYETEFKELEEMWGKKV